MKMDLEGMVCKRKSSPYRATEKPSPYDRNCSNDPLSSLGCVSLSILDFAKFGLLLPFRRWVADEYRHRGIGKKLMSLAEDEGRRRGCHHARLETSEAQAPGFYFKLGYSVFGVLDDYPKGLKLYFFQKALKV